MLLQNKQVAIVGGGPGGLTLARLLQRKGVNVKVYERDIDEHARVQGSPLDLHDNSGLAAIREADLLAEFKANFLPGADKLTLTNEKAEVVYSDHETKQEDNFGAIHFRPEISRGSLRKILLYSLHSDTVVWNSHLLSMQAEGTGWLLHFKNGTTAYADVVIAADGANSKIRPYITDIKPFYSGITMLEGAIYNVSQTAPGMYALLKGGKIMAFGNGQDLLMGNKGNDEIGFYASFKAEEKWAANNGLNYADKADMLAWFKTAYPDWNPIWHELFEAAAAPFIPRPIYCMPFNQTWKTMPNLTMLGDAAHVMPPFAGEGANMAMLDALELYTNLTGSAHSTVKDAITAYEENMCTRASKAAQESLENGERMHCADALQNMLQLFGSHGEQ